MAGGPVSSLTAEDGVESTWRGDFGEAWIEAIATAAMGEAFTARSDKNKSDLLLLHENGEVVRVQVKATETPKKVGSAYKLKLSIDAYDRLRQGGTRGFVALVVLHQPQPHWTAHTGHGSQVRATCYLVELTGRPSKTGQSSVTLSLPPSTMLTQSRVMEIFEEEGGAVAAT